MPTKTTRAATPPMYDFHNAKAKREHWAAEREHAAFRKDAGELIELTTPHRRRSERRGRHGARQARSLGQHPAAGWRAAMKAAVRATLVDQVELLLRDLADRMQRHANEGADSL